MITITSINQDGNEMVWNYNSVDDLDRAYWAEDADVPSNDDPIVNVTINNEIKLYFNTFDEVAEAFGLYKTYAELEKEGLV